MVCLGHPRGMLKQIYRQAHESAVFKRLMYDPSLPVVSVASLSLPYQRLYIYITRA